MTDKWLTCAPVMDYWDKSGSIRQSLEFANGVKLESLPDWVKTEKALKFIGWSRRQSISKFALIGFTIQYEAGSLGDPDTDWKGTKPRSKQEKAIEQILLANLSIWIAKPSKFSYDTILHFDRPGDPESIRQSISTFGLVPHHFDADTELSAEDFDTAIAVHNSICSLHRDGNLWTASRLLWRALSERMWEARFLLLWVVMEALFGPTDPREITYRLSQRVAFFLGQNRDEIEQLFNNTKALYSLRSKTVHGARLSKLPEDRSAQVLYDVEKLARKSISKILLDDRLIKKFDGKKRDEFLDNRMFECVSEKI